MQAVLIVALVGLLAIAAGNPACVCTKEYKPVCGLDGTTYGNQCAMDCKGVQLAHTGPCRTPRKRVCHESCPRVYDPVCGTDHVTYPNKCEMKCRGVLMAQEGACRAKRFAGRCTCPRIYNPVCGKNGRTYSNACEMKCRGSVLAHDGRCRVKRDAENVCICPYNYEPVCGKDGATYGNTCEMKCSEVELAHEGECNGDATGDTDTVGEHCVCTLIYQPVCGRDGQTYGNMCEMECFGAELAQEGECEGDGAGVNVNEPCICSVIYEPVCGLDGKTYGNMCDMGCYGAELAHEGECNEDTAAVEETVDEQCKCTLNYEPVCGLDGQTYGNMCEMECYYVELAHIGECETATS